MNTGYYIFSEADGTLSKLVFIARRYNKVHGFYGNGKNRL